MQCNGNGNHGKRRNEVNDGREQVVSFRLENSPNNRTEKKKKSAIKIAYDRTSRN